MRMLLKRVYCSSRFISVEGTLDDYEESGENAKEY